MILYVITQTLTKEDITLFIIGKMINRQFTQTTQSLVQGMRDGQVNTTQFPLPSVEGKTGQTARQTDRHTENVFETIHFCCL